MSEQVIPSVINHTHPLHSPASHAQPESSSSQGYTRSNNGNRPIVETVLKGIDSSLLTIPRHPQLSHSRTFPETSKPSKTTLLELQTASSLIITSTTTALRVQCTINQYTQAKGSTDPSDLHVDVNIRQTPTIAPPWLSDKLLFCSSNQNQAYQG